MRKDKRRALLLLLLFVTLFATGCWNRRELDRIAIVSAVAIDIGEDKKVKLTVQIIKAGAIKAAGEGGSAQEKPVLLLTSSGDTVFEAVRNFVDKSGRKLFWSHTMLIVLGEKMAREGILPVLDWFIRDHEMFLLTWVVVAKGEGGEVLKGDPGLEKIQASHLDRMIKDYGALSKSVAVNLLDVSNMVACEATHPVIGMLSKKESGEENKKGVYSLRGAGVFRKDKLIGWLNPAETRGYLWIRGRAKSGIITITSPEQKDKLISLEVIKAESKIKPQLEDGKIKYTLEVSVESNLGEQMSQEELANPEMFSVLEEEQRKAVEKEISATISKAQEEFKVNILGLGAATMRKLPTEWKKLKEHWEEEFPQAEVQVKVDSKLRHTGMLRSLKMQK